MTAMIPTLRFEAPHVGLHHSYRSPVREFVELGEPLVPFPLAFANENFAAFLDRLSACARGEGIPEGFVPHSTYWLVHNGTEVVGVSNLRHRLTDALRFEGGHIGFGVRPTARRRGFANELLRHTLAQARALGVHEAWLTCDKTNTASIQTILRNNGILVSEEFIPKHAEIVQRYRIPVEST